MTGNNGKIIPSLPIADIDPVTAAPERPDGAGMYLHWDGRKSYRTHMPVPRVLEPVPKLSFGDADGNFVIEGDNLQVMVSLRPQYRSTVDIAYIDAPYNTGKNDFRYSDHRFHDPNADSDDAVYVNNEDGGRHTKWLNFMAPRLYLTHELLADHGICFVSINDIELFRLGMLMDEIFGERNRLGIIVWKQMADNNPTRISIGHEYILCYSKQVENVPPVWQGVSAAKEWLIKTYEALKGNAPKISQLQREYQRAIRDYLDAYQRSLQDSGETALVDLGALERYKFVDERGPYAAVRDTAVHQGAASKGYFYDIVHPVTGQVCKKPGSGYRFSPEKMRQLQADDRLIFGRDHTQLVQLKKYLKDVNPPLRGIIELDSRKGGATLKRLFPGGAERFSNPKPVELLTQIIGFAGDMDALVLDPFAGSGTTAHAVLQLNAQDGGGRRFILIEEGTPQDRFCRTLTAPRIRAAIDQEELKGGFGFLETGRKLNRDAILELERQAITSLIIQTDVTGTGGGIARVAGEHVIAYNSRREAICLRWNGRSDSTITSDILTRMFEEAKNLRLNKPLRVYGSTCVVAETESFRFCQIPDEIVAALNLSDEGDSITATVAITSVEALERASQGLTTPHGRR